MQAGPLTVWWERAIYNAGYLKIRDIGHPVNVLTLKVSPGTDTFEMRNDAGSTIISLRGCQRVTVSGFTFTGTVGQATQGTTGNAVAVRNSADFPKNPSRWITFDNCIWKKLEHLTFAALSIYGAARDITVNNCRFWDVGPTNGVHMIYSQFGPQGITITNSKFTRCTGDYVKFKDDAEFAKVDNCEFHSTADPYNWEMIRVAVFNDVNPGDEFQGTNYQFTNNSFDWDTDGNIQRRWGVVFTASGHNVPSPLDYWVSASEGNTLNTGTAAQKEAILSPQMGLTNARVKIYGNTFAGAHGQVMYRHMPAYGSGNGGYTDACNITNWPATSGTLAAPPMVRNGLFEFPGDRRRCWFAYAGSTPANHPGLNGTANSVRLIKSSNTQFGQPLESPTSVLTPHFLVGIGSDHTGTGMKFKAKIYHHEIANGAVVVAVDHLGQVGYENSSGTFVPVASLGTLQFAVDGNGDGTYVGGAGDAMRWYQFRVNIDYSGATPTFTIYRGDVNAAPSYTHNSGPISTWTGAPAVAGSRPGSLVFENHGANVIIDQVW